MHKKRLIYAAFGMAVSFIVSMGSIPVYSASVGTNKAYQIQSLKKGMRSDEVFKLQSELKKLGYFNTQPTGYYGEITKEAVLKFQRANGLRKDGVASSETRLKIKGLAEPVAKKASAQSLLKKSTSRGYIDRENYLLPWFGVVENVFARGDTASVYDIGTGLSFRIKRTYGFNHADCETLTLKDTEIMKKIYDGKWSWERRAVIVKVDGRRIAASMAGMPHAGVDNLGADMFVGLRSGGYGSGINLDAIKDNKMDGHFDIHFLGSKTHGTDRVDEGHQGKVKEAAAWAMKNY